MRISTDGRLRFVALLGVAFLWIPTLAPSVRAQPQAPASVARAGTGSAGLWQLRSQHLVWGMPRQTDNRHNVLYPGETEPRPGVTVLVREGFVVGHYDFYKVPAWVSMRWTREDFENLFIGSFGRDFGPDPDLPRYARAGDDYEFSTSAMERGHMARHEDNEAWGRDNSDNGCLMSNIVPQHKDMNGEAWNDLEELHQGVVVDSSLAIDTVWIISGPIYEDLDGDGDEDPVSFIGNDVAVPQATFKVIGWFDAAGDFQVRGYVVRQEDRIRHQPERYLVAIDEIELLTGLDFFPELPLERAEVIESAIPVDLWGPAAVVDEEDEAERQILISALLPNPVGDESREEAVTLRNEGTGVVSLAGWHLRDDARRTWVLVGIIDPGDEVVVLRDRQPMALNNGGDTVELVDDSGIVVHSVTYTDAQEGEVIDVDDLQ